MTTLPPGVFCGTIVVHPDADLQLAPRIVDGFEIQSSGIGRLSATTSKPDAWNSFIGKHFLQSLEMLSWDVLWECLIAVQFEPGSATQGESHHRGRKIVMVHAHDTISSSDGNPRAGIVPHENFGLLQRIRDYIVSRHLAAGNRQRNSALTGDATLLLAIEHFLKGVVLNQYALAEFYSVVETIENRLGGRRALLQSISKAELDKITSYANQPQFNQRHAPIDATAVSPLPQGAVRDAASVAKTLIVSYATQI